MRGGEPDTSSMCEHPAGASVATAEHVEAILEAGRLAALGELTAGACHEINNPLFAILTLVEFLLREAEPGTKAYERLQLIQGSARDIEGVVGRVHRFARERSGDGNPFPLEEAARAAVALVRHASGARNVELAETYPAAPALVAGEPGRIKQIFVSLLLNALQAMPDGGTVAVAVAREGHDVVATVADDGPGIRAAQAERVFELWETGRPGARAGLGLAVSRAIAELHGGTLTVDTDVPRGGRLVLRLPEASA